MIQEKQERLTPQGLPYKNLENFVNEDGEYLFCRYWEPSSPPRALVMIVHGAGEHSGSYMNLASMLVNQSLFVFSHDHVGHGQSEGQRLNVSNFKVFVRDSLQHIDMMKRRHPGLKIFLLAHSMGGLIAIYVMLDRPQDIAGAILIAPLVTLNPQSAKPWKVASFTADALCHHGAMKVGFAAVLLNAIAGLENLLPTIVTPVLILHGDADKMCNVKGSQLMYELAASTDKTLKVFEECFHQLHKELPEVVKEVLELIQSWLNERLPSTKEMSQS
ncbi:monoglyceride lipase-like isoform X2 [Rhinoraja longicauda]